MIKLTCWISIPLPRRSVEIRILEDPDLNSLMTLTLSDISMSPEMQETTNLCSASLSASSLTLSLRLGKDNALSNNHVFVELEKGSKFLAIFLK